MGQCETRRRVLALFDRTHERNVAHHDDPRHGLAIAVRRRQIELEPAQLRLAIGLLRELLPVDVQVECDEVEDCQNTPAACQRSASGRRARDEDRAQMRHLEDLRPTSTE